MFLLSTEERLVTLHMHMMGGGEGNISSPCWVLTGDVRAGRENSILELHTAGCGKGKGGMEVGQRGAKGGEREGGKG